ncbi:AaceriAGR189Wp [[Ashbya] aceris (nom. inval.)]|nr:AaceriAGR189Wp [[Ashbya] aceris (nom. inval.)]
MSSLPIQAAAKQNLRDKQLLEHDRMTNSAINESSGMKAQNTKATTGAVTLQPPAISVEERIELLRRLKSKANEELLSRLPLVREKQPLYDKNHIKASTADRANSMTEKDAKKIGPPSPRLDKFPIYFGTAQGGRLARNAADRRGRRAAVQQSLERLNLDYLPDFSKSAHVDNPTRGVRVGDTDGRVQEASSPPLSIALQPEVRARASDARPTGANILPPTRAAAEGVYRPSRSSSSRGRDFSRDSSVSLRQLYLGRGTETHEQDSSLDDLDEREARVISLDKIPSGRDSALKSHSKPELPPTKQDTTRLHPPKIRLPDLRIDKGGSAFRKVAKRLKTTNIPTQDSSSRYQATSPGVVDLPTRGLHSNDEPESETLRGTLGLNVGRPERLESRGAAQEESIRRKVASRNIPSDGQPSETTLSYTPASPKEFLGSSGNYPQTELTTINEEAQVTGTVELYSTNSSDLDEREVSIRPEFPTEVPKINSYNGSICPSTKLPPNNQTLDAESTNRDIDSLLPGNSCFSSAKSYREEKARRQTLTPELVADSSAADSDFSEGLSLSAGRPGATFEHYDQESGPAQQERQNFSDPQNLVASLDLENASFHERKVIPSTGQSGPAEIAKHTVPSLTGANTALHTTDQTELSFLISAKQAEKYVHDISKTWNNIEKQELLRLMDRAVVRHTPFSANPNIVSASNDICQVHNFEEVDVNYYQRLPTRLVYVDLYAPQLPKRRGRKKKHRISVPAMEAVATRNSISATETPSVDDTPTSLPNDILEHSSKPQLPDASEVTEFEATNDIEETPLVHPSEEEGLQQQVAAMAAEIMEYELKIASLHGQLANKQRDIDRLNELHLKLLGELERETPTGTSQRSSSTTPNNVQENNTINAAIGDSSMDNNLVRMYEQQISENNALIKKLKDELDVLKCIPMSGRKQLLTQLNKMYQKLDERSLELESASTEVDKKITEVARREKALTIAIEDHPKYVELRDKYLTVKGRLESDLKYSRMHYSNLRKQFSIFERKFEQQRDLLAHYQDLCAQKDEIVVSLQSERSTLISRLVESEVGLGERAAIADNGKRSSMLIGEIDKQRRTRQSRVAQRINELEEDVDITENEHAILRKLIQYAYGISEPEVKKEDILQLLEEHGEIFSGNASHKRRDLKTPIFPRSLTSATLGSKQIPGNSIPTSGSLYETCSSKKRPRSAMDLEERLNSAHKIITCLTLLLGRQEEEMLRQDTGK